VRLAFYQPDIPQNLGAALRLSACFGTPLDIIDPCGFPLTDRALRRSAMDYQAHVEVSRHASFVAFMTQQEKRPGRLILIETDGPVGLYDAVFGANDTLILGRESAGSPPEVRAAADAIVRIPMVAGMRSLNVAMAAGIALAEALRQTGGMAKVGDGA
jgi:tRNA (cytidine/uridine-2'-O-)-methyltransferase